MRITPILALRMAAAANRTGSGGASAVGPSMVQVQWTAYKVVPGAGDLAQAVIAGQTRHHLGPAERALNERRARALKGLRTVDGVHYLDGCAGCFTAASDLELDVAGGIKPSDSDAKCEECGADWRVRRNLIPKPA